MFTVFAQARRKRARFKDVMSMNSSHESVSELSDRYFKSKGEFPREITSFYFCDNEKDANECADLVLQREKRATATSLWWYEANKEELPKAHDNYIVTNWQGIALCVIEVERVEIVPFNEITSEFAEIEGEGDKSLEYWKKVHWDYYHRELEGSKFGPQQNMLIVCEYFRVVFQ